MFNNYLRPALVSFAALTLLTGVTYPLVTTGAVQILFPAQANGSLIKDTSGQVIGSTLIGQPFVDAKHFWSRPSACAKPYDGAPSVGTNKTPVGDDFLTAVKDRIAALKQADPENTRPIPQDLVTASASGLDPHISPEAADYQVHRVAKARGLSEDAVKALVAAHTESPQLGVLGMPRVNVLALNLAMDATK